jgi:hypothetical protein
LSGRSWDSTYGLKQGKAAAFIGSGNARLRLSPAQSQRPDPMRRSKVASPVIVSLEDEIAHLRGLDLKVMRSRWQSVAGREAPSHLSRQLLFSMIAYRIQAEALGDLDAVTLRLLKKIGSNHSDHENMALTEAFDQRRRMLSPGTVLTREWNGQTYRVMVVSEGFAWDGRTYDSLSKIASAITGTQWNGPRFFGLRDRTPAEVAS